jgi:16S rRNA (guanine1207-N2)-methyltransferase
MSSQRLSFALTSGGLALPEAGTIVLYGAPGDAELPAAAERIHVTQGFRPDVEAWQARGLDASPALPEAAAAVIVTLPRARELAEDRIARAAALASELVVVDGAKTDGIEAIAKALRGRVELLGQTSKAHGKCLWFRPTQALADWRRPESQTTATGDVTAPGVFSADGADPASVALAAALPMTLKGRIADLGAGWGWLSREILRRPAVKSLHLVEADHAALDCARQNVSDARAAFHWADATRWAPETPLDAVVTNPPFHVGRRADPALGRAFLEAGARMLAPHGQLWLVANRHLPYETTLDALFRDVTEIGGDSRFKILQAARKRR